MKRTSGKSSMVRQAAQAGPECLTDDQLRVIVDNAGPEEEQAVARRHLDTCLRCSSELALLRSFLDAEPAANETEDVSWIVGQLQQQGELAPAPVEEPDVARSNWWDSFRIPRTWAIPLAAAAIVLLTFGVGVVSKREPTLRGLGAGEEVFRSGRFELLAPIGELSDAPGRLEWEAVTGAETYVIRVYEVDRSEVWTGTTAENRLPVPVELNRFIVPGKALVWDVEALGSDGQPVGRSGAGQFRLSASKELR